MLLLRSGSANDLERRESHALLNPGAPRLPPQYGRKNSASAMKGTSRIIIVMP